MPILDIEIVLHPNETLPNGLAAELADCAGEIFGSAPRETWVKLRPILAEHYAENSVLPQEEIFPIFVIVLKAQRTPISAMQVEVSSLTSAIARVCGRPEENVHIHYQPEGMGRVAFGGKLISE